MSEILFVQLPLAGDVIVTLRREAKINGRSLRNHLAELLTAHVIQIQESENTLKNIKGVK